MYILWYLNAKGIKAVVYMFMWVRDLVTFVKTLIFYIPWILVMQDVPTLNAFFQSTFGITPEEKQLSVSGKNHGDVDLNGMLTCLKFYIVSFYNLVVFLPSAYLSLCFRECFILLEKYEVYAAYFMISCRLV